MVPKTNRTSSPADAVLCSGLTLVTGLTKFAKSRDARNSEKFSKPAGSTPTTVRSDDPTFTGRQWPLADVRLLAPILASKVVCIGKNYAAHIAEMGGGEFADPIIFMKPNTAIIGPNVPIQLPADANPVHFEGELAAIIGRPCKDVPAARVAENILRAVQRNRAVAPISPEAWVLYYLKRLSPALVTWIGRWGQARARSV